MRAMKEASIRVLAYLAVALLVAAAFNTPTTPAVVVVWAILAVIGEPVVIVRNLIHNRRAENRPTKGMDVPETNRFDR